MWRILYLVCIGMTASCIAYAQQSIEQLATDYVKPRHQKGLLVGWIDGEEVSQKGYGGISQQINRAPDPDDVFEIGSCTQAFTAIWALQMERDGLFSLQDVVEEYLPADTDIPSWQSQRCTDVIVREGGKPQRITMCTPDPLSEPSCIIFCDLLTHTSGLPINFKGNYNWQPFYQGLQMTDGYTDVPKEEFYRLLSAIELDQKPGRGFSYSNLGMALVGHSIADIYQLPYEALIQSVVLSPLKLEFTGFTPTAKNIPGFTHRGHGAEPSKCESMSPAAGLYASGSDLIRFIKLQLKPPARWRSLFQDARQERIELEDPRQPGTLVSYAWWISYTGEYGNVPVYWRYGGTEGFRAFMAFCPDYQTGLVLLANSPGPLKELGFSMLEILHAEK